MSKLHRYTVNPEFNGLEKFVWEGLNHIGQPIAHIKKGTCDVSTHKKSLDKPIWHTKSELDKFVAEAMNLRLEDYGKDMSKNSLYKAIANEIGELRRKNILIDLHHIKSRNTGMGIWRLDKTKLDQFVYRRVKKEINNKNFHSDGSIKTVYARTKQTAFKKILENQYHNCVLCEFEIPEYMIGAHIVPYNIMRENEPKNSMNPTNGLLFCRFCDKAFEIGDIMIGRDLSIEISSHLQDHENKTVKKWISSVKSEIHIRHDVPYPPDPKYLKWKKQLVIKST